MRAIPLRLLALRRRPGLLLVARVTRHPVAHRPAETPLSGWR